MLKIESVESYKIHFIYIFELNWIKIEMIHLKSGEMSNRVVT